jgi:polysaccharide biosynthesis transport protein
VAERMTQSFDDLPSSLQSTGPGIFKILWRRKPLVLLGTVLGIVAGVIFFFQQPPKYQSSADLVVWKRLSSLLGSSSGVDSRMAVVEDYVGTQTALVRSHQVLSKAAAKLNSLRSELHDIPSGDLLGYIQSGLNVVRSKETGATGTTGGNILTISFRGPSAEDCEKVVNAVIEAYRDSLGLEVESTDDNERNMVTKAQEELKKEIETNRSERQKVDQKMTETNKTPLDQVKSRIAAIEGQLLDLNKQKLDIESRIKQIQKGKAEGKDPKLLLVLYQLTSGKTEKPFSESRTTEDVLMGLKLQEEELLQTLGEKHPQVVALRRRIQVTQKYIEKFSQGADQPPSPKELLEICEQTLEEEKQKVEEIENGLRNKLVADSSVVSALESLANQKTELQNRLEELLRQRSDLDQRLRAITIRRDAPLYDARVINPAGVGGKVSPLMTVNVAMGLIMGLLLGVGLAFLADFTDKSFRSPDEIRTRLNTSIIGHIPALTPHEAVNEVQKTLDPLLVVHHRPKSVEAEAYRGLRTSLYFSTHGKGHQVIQVTSANPQDGKSTLIANLATAIAQSNKKIVLIDCDFRKPRVHKIFGLPSSDVGLTSVLLGDATLEEAIQTCAVPGLHLLPCGERPSNPAELLSSPKYREFLDQIRKQYDFVLIDTPPLLAVSDPAIVSTQVCGTILALKLTKYARPAAERAKEILTTMGANVLGIVVNDIEASSRNGFDTSYGSYGYGYNYQYAYEYSDDDLEEAGSPRKSR